MEEKSLVELFPNLFDLEEDEFVKKSFSYSEKDIEEYEDRIEIESTNYAKSHIVDAENYEDAVSEVKYHFRNGAVWQLCNISFFLELDDDQLYSVLGKAASFYCKKECEEIFPVPNDISEEEASSLIEEIYATFEDGSLWAFKLDLF